jgi:Rieske Fe-S protein
MRRESLPTVPATASASDEGCPDCTRRLVVQALGVTAAASLLGLGCGGDDGPTADAADPLAGTMMCGANLCVLLNDPANALLLEVEGSRVITMPGDIRLLIVRRAIDDFVVLSAKCTHAGCTVRYDANSNQAACPCHGSRYSLAGTVVVGPATRSLGQYSATFDAATQTLTIVL